MFARKNQGTIPKYLKKNSYYGGIFKINNQEKKILINKRIYLITKYFGVPIVLYNLYKSKGCKEVFLSIYDNIFKYKK